MVSQPCLGVKPPSGAQDQIFITARQLWIFDLGGSLPEERTGLSFTIDAGPQHCSHSHVQVPRAITGLNTQTEW
jgi:hypothetical protein